MTRIVTRIDTTVDAIPRYRVEVNYENGVIHTLFTTRDREVVDALYAAFDLGVEAGHD